MGRLKFNRLAIIGLIFIILGFIGKIVHASQISLSFSYFFIAMGFIIIFIGIGKKLREWVGLD